MTGSIDNRPILFQGTPLPHEAYWLELVPHIVSGISERADSWLLDLHYCLGRVRTAESRDIICHVREIRRAIEHENAALTKGIRERLPSRSPREMIEGWKNALSVIESLALSCDRCSWCMPASEAEMRNAGAVMMSIFDEFCRQHPHADVSPERAMLRELSSLRAEDQIALLHRVLDSIGRHGRD